METVKLIVNIKIIARNFAQCFALLLVLASPIFASTAVTKVVKGQNVYITVAEKQDKPWWLDSALQILTIATGFGIVIFQLGRQHKNAIQLEEKNAKKKLYLEIYQTITEQITKSSKATVNLSIVGITLPDKIWDYASKGIQDALSERIERINSEFYNYSNDINNFIFFLDEYEIALKEFDIFRVVFFCQLNRIREAYISFANRIELYLPIDFPEHMNMKPIPSQKPSEESIENLKKAGKELDNSLNDMSSYLHDFRVEAQNHLLGDLFKRKIASRKPTDSKYLAITNDISDIQKIMDHFNVREEDKQRWAEAIARDNV